LYSALAPMVGSKLLPSAALAVFLALTYEAWHTYFVLWARNPLVVSAFDTGYVELAGEVNAYPRVLPKAVVVEDGRSTFLPPSAAVVMYLTKTYTQREREEAHLRYYTRHTFDHAVPAELEGANFCEQATAVLVHTKVFCLR
jgi:hypothetical protein